MWKYSFLDLFIRARNSVVFTPAASQEDITVLSSEESDLDLSEAGIKEKSGEDEDVRALDHNLNNKTKQYSSGRCPRRA